MNKLEGGSGEKRNTPNKDVKKEMRDAFELVRIKYVDQVLYKNKDSSFVKPSVRETVGWIYEENDEYILLFHDQPLNRQTNEYLHPESGILILRCTILDIWDINCQSLRSRKLD